MSKGQFILRHGWVRNHSLDEKREKEEQQGNKKQRKIEKRGAYSVSETSPVENKANADGTAPVAKRKCRHGSNRFLKRRVETKMRYFAGDEQHPS